MRCAQAGLAVRRVLAEDLDLARRSRVAVALEDLHRRGLARAVRSEQREDLARARRGSRCPHGFERRRRTCAARGPRSPGRSRSHPMSGPPLRQRRIVRREPQAFVDDVPQRRTVEPAATRCRGTRPRSPRPSPTSPDMWGHTITFSMSQSELSAGSGSSSNTSSAARRYRPMRARRTARPRSRSSRDRR